MDTLKLSLPRQHDYSDPTVERDVRRLRDSLSNLPIMDVGESVRLVLGRLDALNEQKLDHRLRFDCLEAYRSTAQRLFQTLDPLHLRQLAMSKARRLGAIEGVARVFHSLAGGYKLIVAGNYPAAGQQPPAILGPAINRAVEQLTYILLDCCRFYRDVQPELLAELNQLYLAARRHGLLNTRMEAESDNQEPATTAMLYHAAMLLSLVEPERLAEGEAGLLFDLLMQHAGVCKMIPGGSWSGTGTGMFLVDLHSDRLPQFCTSLTPPVAIRDPYLLDASLALQEISRQLERTPEQVRMLSPEAMLLNRLLPEAAGQQLRNEVRSKDGRHVELLLGLDTIHAWIQVRDGTGDNRGVLNRATPCRVLDSSAGGMKLAWETGSAGDARVGDLLGVVETHDTGSALQLAVIRSLRVSGTAGLETGIQILAGEAGAVRCRLKGQDAGSAVRALFIPAGESDDHGASLLAEKGFYREAAVLLVDSGGQEIPASAGAMLVETPVFDRFELLAD